MAVSSLEGEIEYTDKNFAQIPFMGFSSRDAELTRLS
jgi:hypothetical protein